MIDITLLSSATKNFGCALSDDQLSLLDRFSELVAEQNKKFNLTAITDPIAFTEKHLIDSLAAFSFLPDSGSLCDVGAGAGFPSFPLAVAKPSLSVTALDSTAKKTAFIASAVRSLGVENLSVLTGRAEEMTHQRESFSVVTARAVAPLPVLLEYCLPFVKVGGTFIAYKGPEAEEEIKISSAALKKLGGKIDRIVDASDGTYSHNLIVITKSSSTPKAYPRKAGTPSKTPL